MLPLTLNMSKELSMPVKQVTIKLKNQNNPISSHYKTGSPDLKKLEQQQTTYSSEWTDDTKINLDQNDTKRRGHRKKCFDHHHILCVYVCQSNWFPSIFHDVTADKSSRMDSEVFKAWLFAQFYPNASKLIGWYFIEQMDYIPKHTFKASPDIFLRQRSRIRCNCHVFLISSKYIKSVEFLQDHWYSTSVSELAANSICLD